MLISAQNVVSAQTKTPWPSSMYRHQVEAYRELNEDLADPERRYSFEAMINLTCAVHVENRTAGPQRAKLHLKALERIREGRQGRFIEQSGSTFAVIRACSYTTYLLCECELDTLEELHVAKKIFLNKMRKIQDWRRAYGTAGASDSRTEALVALTDPGAHLTFAQAKSNFAQNPHIQKVLQMPTCYTTYQHIAALFSVVLFIHISTHDLGLQLAPAFLSRTIILVDSSAMSDPTTGTSLFKLPALCMVVSKVVVDVMQGHSAYAFKLDEHGEDESSHLRGVIIEGLKFFSYLGQDTRMRLVRLLMSWMTEGNLPSVDYTVGYSADSMLQHGDWVAMCSEADRNWHVEQQEGQKGQ